MPKDDNYSKTPDKIEKSKLDLEFERVQSSFKKITNVTFQDYFITERNKHPIEKPGDYVIRKSSEPGYLTIDYIAYTGQPKQSHRFHIDNANIDDAKKLARTLNKIQNIYSQYFSEQEATKVVKQMLDEIEFEKMKTIFKNIKEITKEEYFNINNSKNNENCYYNIRKSGKPGFVTIEFNINGLKEGKRFDIHDSAGMIEAQNYAKQLNEDIKEIKLNFAKDKQKIQNIADIDKKHTKEMAEIFNEHDKKIKEMLDLNMNEMNVFNIAKNTFKNIVELNFDDFINPKNQNKVINIGDFVIRSSSERDCFAISYMDVQNVLNKRKFNINYPKDLNDAVNLSITLSKLKRIIPLMLCLKLKIMFKTINQT